MCMIDGDGPEFSVVTHRVARRPHKCGECRREIEVGERYHRNFQVYDGHPDTCVMCSQCECAANGWLGVVCGGWLYEGVLIDLEEHAAGHWYPIRTMSLWRLIVGMRDQWRRPDGVLWPAETVAMWAANGARLATTKDMAA